MKPTTTKGIAAGLEGADAATARLVGYARAAEGKKSSHLPVDFKEDFASNMARPKGEKAPVMRRQQALLESHYDVSNRPAEGVRMSGEKPVQQGVRARLPHGMRWETLAPTGLTATEKQGSGGLHAPALRAYAMRNAILTLVMMALPLPLLAADVEPLTRPPGEKASPKTSLLKAGAALLQTDNPLEPMNVYLNGFHAMKSDPAHQMVAHHFCSQVNEDFAQCVLFDGNTRDANLNGIEYIISEKLFNQLPAEERQYWHPHNYEILSGQLVGPGLPDVAEKALMKGKINSYGKTWHVWNTEMPHMKGDPLPYGAPSLAWSFNRDGEAAPGLVEGRDRVMGIDSAQIRRKRADLVSLAKPQSGVDVLHGKFPRPTQPFPGVTDLGSGTRSPNVPAPETGLRAKSPR